MPSQVNPDYIPPNYRPNYRVPQTRTVRTPAQPNLRDIYDYYAEQRELTASASPAYTRNLPQSLQDAIARGEQSPWGYDSGAPATPWNYNPNKYGGVGRNKKASGALQTALAAANNYNEWYDIWHMPRETLAELIARGAVDPWASDPYEIGGHSLDAVYNANSAEESYSGWGGGGYGGWGGWGGGGSYSSSPGIYGDSVRKNQWYSTLLQWNIT